MPLKPEPKLSIEVLRERYDKLNTTKIRTETELKNAEDILGQLRKEARESWGTDDLDALQKKLQEMTEENERRRGEYQEHLEKIDADLADVERTFTEKSS